MNVQEFEELLAKGLGRVVLYLRDHDSRPYHDSILHACLHNLAYDPQVEGDRATFMYDVVRCTKDQEFFRQRILQGLLEAHHDWDVRQLFHFTRLYAEQGDTEARDAMYEKFTRDSAEEHIEGGDEIVRLDGISGLLFVANCIGDKLLSDSECFGDDYPIYVAKETCGEVATMAALEEAAKGNKRVRAYMDNATALVEGSQRAFQQHQPLANMSYEEILRDVARRPTLVPRGRLSRWGQKADPMEIEKAADSLLQTDREEMLTAHLHIFQSRALPRGHDRLLKLAGEDNLEVSKAALRALRNVKHESVRMLAFELFGQGKANDEVAGLLINNYEDGDHLLVESAISRTEDKHELHSLGFTILDIFQKNSTSNCRQSLVMLYEKGPCSSCREPCVEMLVSRSLIPDWMLGECEYDSNLDIREKVKQH